MFWLLDHKKVYGAIPSIGFTTAEPSQYPKHVGLVGVIVGDSKGNLMFLEAQESLIKSNSNDLQRFEINILNSQSKKNTKTDIKDNDNDVVEDDDIYVDKI